MAQTLKPIKLAAALSLAFCGTVLLVGSLTSSAKPVALADAGRRLNDVAAEGFVGTLLEQGTAALDNAASDQVKALLADARKAVAERDWERLLEEGTKAIDSFAPDEVKETLVGALDAIKERDILSAMTEGDWERVLEEGTKVIDQFAPEEVKTTLVGALDAIKKGEWEQIPEHVIAAIEVLAPELAKNIPVEAFNNFFMEALKALTEGEWEKLGSAAIKLAPDQVKALLSDAQKAVAEGDWERLLEEGTKAVDKFAPEEVKEILVGALDAIKERDILKAVTEGDWEHLLEEGTKVIDQFAPEEVKATLVGALNAIKKGEWEQIPEQVIAAIEVLAPELAKNIPVEALNNFFAAIKLAPDQVKALLSDAQKAVAEGDWERLLEEGMKAVDKFAPEEVKEILVGAVDAMKERDILKAVTEGDWERLSEEGTKVIDQFAPEEVKTTLVGALNAIKKGEWEQIPEQVITAIEVLAPELVKNIPVEAFKNILKEALKALTTGDWTTFIDKVVLGEKFLQQVVQVIKDLAPDHVEDVIVEAFNSLVRTLRKLITVEQLPTPEPTSAPTLAVSTFSTVMQLDNTDSLSTLVAKYKASVAAATGVAVDAVQVQTSTFKMSAVYTFASGIGQDVIIASIAAATSVPAGRVTATQSRRLSAQRQLANTDWNVDVETNDAAEASTAAQNMENTALLQSELEHRGAVTTVAVAQDVQVEADLSTQIVSDGNVVLAPDATELRTELRHRGVQASVRVDTTAPTAAPTATPTPAPTGTDSGLVPSVAPSAAPTAAPTSDQTDGTTTAAPDTRTGTEPLPVSGAAPPSLVRYMVICAAVAPVSMLF